MNINISNNELNLINFTGKIIVNEDDNTVSFLDVILREPEESKSVAEYCKIISENMHEISNLKESIKEFEERYKKDKKQIEELENELHQLQWYANEPEETEEEELFDDYESIPGAAAPLEVIIPEVTLKEEILEAEELKPLVIPKIELKADNSGVLAQVEIASKFLKSYKPEKPVRPIPEAKRKQIEEGIIKFFKSRGKKTSFRYNYSEKSKSDAKKEAKEIQALCKTKEHRCICQVFKSLLSSGRIIETGAQKKNKNGKGGYVVLYSLNDLEYLKPKSCCPKCGGFSLVKNENKYSSNEDYYFDKNGSYFTCMTCGEEVTVEEKEAA